MKRKIHYILLMLTPAFVAIFASCKGNETSNDGGNAGGDSISAQKEVFESDVLAEDYEGLNDELDVYVDEDELIPAGHSSIFFPGKVALKGAYKNLPIEFAGELEIGQPNTRPDINETYHRLKGTVTFTVHRPNLPDSIVEKPVKYDEVRNAGGLNHITLPGLYGWIYLERVPNSGIISEGNDFHRDDDLKVAVKFRRIED